MELTKRGLTAKIAKIAKKEPVKSQIGFSQISHCVREVFRATRSLTFAIFAFFAVDASFAATFPPGFPPPLEPADNPTTDAKVALGCNLFFDSRLSINGRLSCASCHTPELAFTDGRARAIGALGDELARGSMTLTNVAYNASYTWANDRVRTLEAQVEEPLFNQHPVEMGLMREGVIDVLVKRAPHYATAFEAAFPAEPQLSSVHIARALAAFERTLISGRSAFDRYVYDDDRAALSPAAKHGMELFYSERGGCSSCHFGVNFAGPIAHRDAPSAAALYASNGLSPSSAAGPSDEGLMKISRDERDRGRFRVPTLRNIELTAPYMHDGRFATLEDVIEHYVRAGANGERGLRPLELTSDDKRALIEFLRSLTDREFVSRPWSKCEPR